MVKDIVWLQARLQCEQVSTQVINDSFFQYQAYLAPESVDLIVTSPPYLNNYHYNRNTRPQLYWLGYAERPQDLKHLEASNFGTYWQTAREQTCSNLNFSGQRKVQVRACLLTSGLPIGAKVGSFKVFQVLRSFCVSQPVELRSCVPIIVIIIQVRR